MPSLSFDDMLSLIEDRSRVLRAAAAEAGLDARVPGCPDWSVRDLVAHLGEVHLFWSAVVAAGPAGQPPAEDQLPDGTPARDLLTWSADATATLVRALSAAGPDRGCWAWWESSGAPMTSGAVARHQVQEAAVHAFDAQQAAGRAEPLPPSAATDGVGEYLTVGLASMGSWPRDPASVLVEAGDGGTWLVSLGTAGAESTELAADEVPAQAPAVTVTASPSDLILALYRREPLAEPKVAGDSAVLRHLLTWPSLD